MSLSQARLWMFRSSVREALETSVTCAFSPERFQMIQESMQPIAMLAALDLLCGRRERCR